MCWRSARQGQLQCETSIFQFLDLTNHFNPQGDSGGPLIMQVTDITPYQLIGVVSGGTARWIKRTNINNQYFLTKFFSRCAQGVPGIYTRFSEYVEWVKETMKTVTFS